MKSYIIHFIRHGSIDDTLAGKYIGTTDAPLSDRGRMDLRKLDYEYKYPGTQVVFTSPLKRCTETAKILYPEQNPLVIDNLSECNFGEKVARRRFFRKTSEGGEQSRFYTQSMQNV